MLQVPDVRSVLHHPSPQKDYEIAEEVIPLQKLKTWGEGVPVSHGP